MRETGERIYTPNDLEELGLLSRVKQWQERKAKRLPYLAIGRKIVYLPRHLEIYYTLCEREAQGRGAKNGGHDAT
jgi:hypothetical protein